MLAIHGMCAPTSSLSMRKVVPSVSNVARNMSSTILLDYIALEMKEITNLAC